MRQRLTGSALVAVLLLALSATGSLGLARVTKGAAPAIGKLPVRVPRFGGGTLYPFGHGLTR